MHACISLFIYLNVYVFIYSLDSDFSGLDIDT